MNVSPANITHLEPNDILVFGSNYAGRHGKGAARLAVKFGAQYGIGIGFSGQTYALPTKDSKIKSLPLDDIGQWVKLFLKNAAAWPDRRFLVTAIGCGLAGYTPEQIAPLFFKHQLPDNVWLPQVFWEARR